MMLVGLANVDHCVYPQAPLNVPCCVWFLDRCRTLSSAADLCLQFFMGGRISQLHGCTSTLQMATVKACTKTKLPHNRHLKIVAELLPAVRYHASVKDRTGNVQAKDASLEKAKKHQFVMCHCMTSC